MKIAVINGSPKRKEDSVTQRLITLFSKKNQDMEISTISVGPAFSGLKKTPELKPEWLEIVQSAEAVIWCFPVYYIWLPSQLVRFLESVRRDNGWKSALQGKYATSVTTSINFFDHTAHRAIHEMSEDLGMRYYSGLSSDMHSLLKKETQKNTLAFFRDFVSAVQEKRYLPATCMPLPEKAAVVPAAASPSGKTEGRKVTLLTDARTEDRTLLAMIDTFRTVSPDNITVFNLNEIGLSSGCIGCLRCSYDNSCSFRDGLKEFIQEQCSTADGLVYAFRTEGRAFSSQSKAFQDRSFVFNHVPYLKGRKAVWLTDGPLKTMGLLQELIRSNTELTGQVLAGMTGGDRSPEELTKTLSALGRELHSAIETDRPHLHTFREVAGRKLFRDFVYLQPHIPSGQHLLQKERVLRLSPETAGDASDPEDSPNTDADPRLPEKSPLRNVHHDE